MHSNDYLCLLSSDYCLAMSFKGHSARFQKRVSCVKFCELFQLCGIVPHSTGCARTEGYYKLSHKQKKGVFRRPDVFLTDINDNVSTSFSKENLQIRTAGFS